MSTSNSLPCNKRRKLSISEVSSLASTSLRTEFVYSVRESTHFEHPSQLDQAGKDSGMLDISQELTEEDICIQSSLPHYCDHIFGRLVGSSQPLREHSQPDGDIGPLLHILESQGFTVTVGSKSQRNKTDSSPSSNGFLKLPPQLFHSPLVSPPRMCPPSDSGHLGPDSRSSLSQWKMCHTTHNVASGFSPIQEQKLKTSIARKNGRSSKPTTTKVMYSCPPNCVTLADCTHDRLESTVCLLALVLQVNSVVEVMCRKGKMAGQVVAMSSLLLGDPTKSYLKLLLWREAASWVERISAGDVVYFKFIRLKSWQEKIVGHTIMYSKVLNLHQPKGELPSKFAATLPASSLQSLQEWGKTHHSYLFQKTLAKSQKAVYYRSSDELGVDSLIHFRAKVLATPTSRAVVLSDRAGKEVILYLLGKGGELWYKDIKTGVGQVWEFLYLAVVLEGSQGNCSLQVTSMSHLRKLSHESTDAQKILMQCLPTSMNECIVVQSIATVLQSRMSVYVSGLPGTVKCKARATSCHFVLGDGSKLALHMLTKLSSLELVSHLLQAAYVGCESCTKPLNQDENFVYEPCFGCMIKGSGGCSSTYYFRPLVINLCDERGSCLEVVASHAVVSKLLAGVTAVELVKASLAQKCAQNDSVKNAVERLLASDGEDVHLWILHRSFTMDENSFIESFTLTLLDCVYDH